MAVHDEVSAADEWRSRSHPVQEDIPFQRTTWKVQAFGWLVVLALVVAAILGAFSDGIFSWTTGRGEDGLQVDYQRFYRNGASSSMVLTLPPAADGQTTEVVLSPSLMRAFALDSVTPPPAAAAAGPDGLHLTFATTGTGLGEVRLNLRPDSIGLVRGAIGIAGGGAAAPVVPFIFP